MHSISSKIDEAFATRERPLALPKGFEDPGSGEKEELLKFLETKREDLNYNTIQWNNAAWYYFDHKFFAYFLPSILKLSIEKPDNNYLLFDFIIWELQRLKPFEAEDPITQKWKYLNVVELGCVLDWLNFILPYSIEDHMEDEVNEAKENVITIVTILEEGSKSC